MPYIGKPYRLGENWFINESVRHPSGCQTSKMVPLSVDQVRRMEGLSAQPTSPAYVERSLQQRINEAIAAGKRPDEVLPFAGHKPSEISESYGDRLKRAEQTEREISRMRRPTTQDYVEVPLGERIANAIAAGKSAADVKPFDGKFRRR